ncbi:MAG: AAA family ATPase [Alphaproteobacteria bacterium]|nr:AAA family ATPase [Alphaproteobacteria bacterium]
MVEFTRLRLTGFKSFVDPTDLDIEKGMTGVVGPNGCGKSNLVEALRWVMGETSAKQMRGGEMDEIIFGGTRDRPARNIAEVTLVMDNRSRNATAQFNDTDELEVSRRIERGKGSVYRVNGRDVRAKDVQLLFADLASGARSTALVSQGRIGAIINAKPAQRRHLLEEAANITGLHSRRHEAELRLKAAETNLERLDDVIQALDVQLQSLKKQARQAARYRTISDSIRAADAMVLTIRQTDAEAELSQASEAFARAEQDVAAKAGVVAEATTAQAAAAEAVPPLRQAEAAEAAKVQRLNLAREQLDEEEQRLAAAQEAAETRLAQLRDDMAREKERIADAKGALDRLGSERSDLEEAQASQADSLEHARTTLKASAQSVEELEGEITRLAATLAGADSSRATARQKEAEAKLRGGRALRRLEEVEEQLDTTRIQAQPALDLQAEETTAKQCEDAMASARSQWEEAETARASAQEYDQASRDQLQELRGEEAKVQAEVVALEGLLAERETDATWSPILDAVTVEPGYEPALGAAVGDDLSGGADDTAPIHWSSLPPFAPPPILPEGVRPLGSVVQAPTKLARRLSQVGIVENRESGMALHSMLKPGQRLVTKDGDLWRWDGFVSTSGAPSSAAQRLKHKNRLKELRGEIEARRAASQEAETRAIAARDRVTNAAETEKERRANVRDSEQALEKARAALAERQRTVAALESRIASLEETQKTLVGERDEAGAQEREAQTTLAELGDGSAERERQANLQRQLGGRRNDLMEARAAYDALTRASEERQRRLAALAEDTQSWSTRRGEAERQLEALMEREGSAVEEVAELAGKPEALAEQRQALMVQLETAEGGRRTAADALTRAEAVLNEANKALREAEQSASTTREERVRREALVTQAQQAIETLAAAIEEKVGCAPADVRAQTRLKDGEEPPPLEKAEKSLQRLISERDNMGAINLRAEQESAELSEQIETLDTEREDLINAIARLRDGINSLNREGRQRLLQSFKEVDGHFRTLFTSLFGGGRAHLSLTEADDPLEAGLEIMASPPGKRLQNLSLLSGGEQALTAIALLFAVFMVNPAPICVLDEVDAPLDDANVDRFCNLITEITKATGTRVIVVTHHRMSMARVDRLFGVTMAERGVSKLVSVNLNEAEAFRDTA